MNSNLKFLILKHSRKVLNDAAYYKMRYFLKFRRRLDLKNPQFFNEKLQYLKLNDRNVFYSTLVDKHAVRQFVKEKIGEEYLIKELGIYRKTHEIDFSELPNSFVLKATHGSGWVILCENKTKLNRNQALKKMDYWLSQNFYKLWGEWPYKDVPPGIICEENISLPDEDLLDYKFYCFNGEPHFVHVDYGRTSNHSRNFYDLNWEKLPFGKGYPPSSNDVQKPLNLIKMIEIAKILSENIPFVRVDLYNVKNKIFFGELTLYPGNGFLGFSPDKYERQIGELLQLNNKNQE